MQSSSEISGFQDSRSDLDSLVFRAARPNGSTSTPILDEQLEDYPDVVSWINDCLDPKDGAQDSSKPNALELAETEKRILSLSATLEVACEEVSRQIERMIDDASRTIPRLTYDIQFMRDKASTLQNTLHDVERLSKSSIDQPETSRALDYLSSLDIIKRNMDTSLSVLREAESWSILESEVIAYLAEKAYAKAATRLSEASKSLAVFQNTPEYEPRRALMVNLQNQLEASLSSALISSINNRDVDSCKAFFFIFRDIEREPEFRGYWYGSKKTVLVDSWNAARLYDCQEQSRIEEHTPSGLRFSTFLSDFYHQILVVMQQERISVMSIFPDPRTTLSGFVLSVMSSLQPSVTQRLRLLSQHYESRVLPELILAFKSSEEFVNSANKVLEKTASPTGPTSDISTPSQEAGAERPSLKTHSRRRSSRLSISLSRTPNRDSFSFGSPGQPGSSMIDPVLEETLLEPFAEYQNDYAVLERKYLNDQLRTLLLGSNVAKKGALLFREQVLEVLNMADEALDRCKALTHGFGAVGLVEALEDLFETFLKISETDLTTSQMAESAPTLSRRIGEELSDLDYSAQDYASFQLSLDLVELCRGFLGRIVNFEAKLREELSQIASSLQLKEVDSVERRLPDVPHGAITLLLGSSLNNMQLQSLLEGLRVQDSTKQGNSKPLLAIARRAVSTFATSCQTFLQSLILAPLKKHLASYPSDPAWGSQGPQSDSNAATFAPIPSFSLSPTQAIQRVAEGLLNLPRLLEVYAEDEALAFSIETLPFITAEMVLAASESAVSGEMAHKPPEAVTGHRRLVSTSLAKKPAPSLAISSLTPDLVTSSWLCSLTISLLSHLTREVLVNLRINGDRGISQLSEDLSYLSQIVKALNIEWEELDVWRSSVALERAAVDKKLSETKEDDIERTVIRAVARIRGWD